MSLACKHGFTYVELMITLAIASLIILGLTGVVGQALQSQDVVSETNKLTRDARFAMQRMVRSIGHSRKLLLPQRDKPASNWPKTSANKPSLLRHRSVIVRWRPRYWRSHYPPTRIWTMMVSRTRMTTGMA